MSYPRLAHDPYDDDSSDGSSDFFSPVSAHNTGTKSGKKSRQSQGRTTATTTTISSSSATTQLQPIIARSASLLSTPDEDDDDHLLPPSHDSSWIGARLSPIRSFDREQQQQDEDDDQEEAGVDHDEYNNQQQHQHSRRYDFFQYPNAIQTREMDGQDNIMYHDATTIQLPQSRPPRQLVQRHQLQVVVHERTRLLPLIPGPSIPSQQQSHARTAYAYRSKSSQQQQQQNRLVGDGLIDSRRGLNGMSNTSPINSFPAIAATSLGRPGPQLPPQHQQQQQAQMHPPPSRIHPLWYTPRSSISNVNPYFAAHPSTHNGHPNSTTARRHRYYHEEWNQHPFTCCHDICYYRCCCCCCSSGNGRRWTHCTLSWGWGVCLLSGQWLAAMALWDTYQWWYSSSSDDTRISRMWTLPWLIPSNDTLIRFGALIIRDKDWGDMRLGLFHNYNSSNNNSNALNDDDDGDDHIPIPLSWQMMWSSPWKNVWLRYLISSFMATSVAEWILLVLAWRLVALGQRCRIRLPDNDDDRIDSNGYKPPQPALPQPPLQQSVPWYTWSGSYFCSIITGLLWMYAWDTTSWIDEHGQAGIPIVTGCALFGTCGVLCVVAIDRPWYRSILFIMASIMLLVSLLERPNNSVYATTGAALWGWSTQAAHIATRTYNNSNNNHNQTGLDREPSTSILMGRVVAWFSWAVAMATFTLPILWIALVGD